MCEEENQDSSTEISNQPNVFKMIRMRDPYEISGTENNQNKYIFRKHLCKRFKNLFKSESILYKGINDDPG